MPNVSYYAYRSTQAWLILAGLQIFCVFVLHQYGLLTLLISADATYLSLVIIFAYFLFTFYCGIRSIYLDRQHIDLDRQLQGHAAQSGSLSGRYFYNQQQARRHAVDGPSGKADANTLLVDVLVEHSHTGHELGWYVCSLLIKAGMVGTVIGFVLMLQSVSGLESFDITQMQDLLITMSAGMGVALYTTLTGVVCSALLGYQYLQLDRAADALVVRTVEAGETGALG